MVVVVHGVLDGAVGTVAVDEAAAAVVATVAIVTKVEGAAGTKVVVVVVTRAMSVHPFCTPSTGRANRGCNLDRVPTVPIATFRTLCNCTPKSMPARLWCRQRTRRQAVGPIRNNISNNNNNKSRLLLEM